MDLMNQIIDRSESKEMKDTFNGLRENLISALYQYWETATTILRGSGIELKSPPDKYFILEKNFVSYLFLYSFFKAGISESRRILYATVNQCLRAMVTGCDNLLDDEYKMVLDTDLPEEGARFRSVLDIMVSDRVLFDTLNNGCEKKQISRSQVSAASSESLRALAKCGAQEASEESGIKNIILPEKVLSDVHHYKTGLLFKSPWAVPSIIENMDPGKISKITDALYKIGIGCQILDDMVDLEMDIRMKRHNYVASLIWHGESIDAGNNEILSNKNRNNKNRNKMISLAGKNENTGYNTSFILNFPDAKNSAAKKALALLNQGAYELFENKHRFVADVTIRFLTEQIGANRFLPEI